MCIHTFLRCISENTWANHICKSSYSLNILEENPVSVYFYNENTHHLIQLFINLWGYNIEFSLKSHTTTGAILPFVISCGEL